MVNLSRGSVIQSLLIFVRFVASGIAFTRVTFTLFVGVWLLWFSPPTKGWCLKASKREASKKPWQRREASLLNWIPSSNAACIIAYAPWLVHMSRVFTKKIRKETQFYKTKICQSIFCTKAFLLWAWERTEGTLSIERTRPVIKLHQEPPTIFYTNKNLDIAHIKHHVG